VDPTVVVTLGNFSSKLLLGTDVGITKLRGQAYRFGEPERHLVPTFHPAAALRGGADVLARMRADLALAGMLVEAG
jgi:DNA polymerase